MEPSHSCRAHVQAGGLEHSTGAAGENQKETERGPVFFFFLSFFLSFFFFCSRRQIVLHRSPSQIVRIVANSPCRAIPVPRFFCNFCPLTATHSANAWTCVPCKKHFVSLKCPFVLLGFYGIDPLSPCFTEAQNNNC